MTVILLSMFQLLGLIVSNSHPLAYLTFTTAWDLKCSSPPHFPTPAVTGSHQDSGLKWKCFITSKQVQSLTETRDPSLSLTAVGTLHFQHITECYASSELVARVHASDSG
jgi:hypothetical protein